MNLYFPPCGSANNSGTIAKDIADLCWVMGIGDGRSAIAEACVGSRKNNLAESAALNPTGDLTNAQFPMLNSHPKWMSDCLRMRIEHWELNIGQVLPSPDFRSSCVAVPDFLCKAFYTLPSKIHWGGCIRRSGTE